MIDYSARAVAHPNIALIKYWGDRDPILRIPANGSISMNLDGLTTTSEVRFESELRADHLVLNGQEMTGLGLGRVSRFLDIVRALAGFNLFAEVISDNDFPTGAGMASSASAFAALSLAAARAAGLNLDENALSRLARRGSGSASRSVPEGFVEWFAGDTDADSYAKSFASPDHWALSDCIAVVQAAHKTVTSSQGHALADSSPYQVVRVNDTPRRLDLCRSAVLRRDFNALAEIVESDSHLMHAVMMTSNPSLLYWEPASIRLMKQVPLWRREGLPVCFTVDAGPNIHVICPAENASQVATLLKQQDGVELVLTAGVGAAAGWIQ